MTRQPTHPGEILKEDVFPALKLKSSKAAEALQISRQYMSDILKLNKGQNDSGYQSKPDSNIRYHIPKPAHKG